MFIYRDEYYNPDTTTRPGVAEVIVAKQRNGPTGSVEMSFQGLLFDNLARPAAGDGYLWWTGRWAAVVCIGVFLSLAGLPPAPPGPVTGSR